MKRFLKRFLCFVTGGHRYEDKNLMSMHEPRTRKTALSNHCIKCGKRYCYVMDLDQIIKADIERFKRRMTLLPIDNKRSETE